MMNPNNFPPKSKVYLTPDEANYSPPHIEGPFGPSMVEPCHNLSIEELVRDYTRGIIHSERQAFYDDGDSVEEVYNPTDIAELESITPAMPEYKADEAGKPSGTPDAKRSDKEEVKTEPVPKEAE